MEDIDISHRIFTLRIALVPFALNAKLIPSSQFFRNNKGWATGLHFWGCGICEHGPHLIFASFTSRIARLFMFFT